MPHNAQTAAWRDGYFGEPPCADYTEDERYWWVCGKRDAELTERARGRGTELWRQEHIAERAAERARNV